jgi:large subunit ribosomal protein L3
MNAILAKKIEQGQKFLENGTRIPVTKVSVTGNIVTAIKTPEKDHYSSVQLGFEQRKKISPKSNKSKFVYLREVKASDTGTLPAIGDAIKASDVFKPGDIINVTGISKGKGYAGGVKRHHFKGGPRTHGQSDRERAPGAIGSTTTPGRVFKGKRMAGKMGHEKATVRNLKIVAVDDNFILIEGLVPGGRNTLLTLKKVGESKKFVPLFVEKIEEVKPAEAKVEEKTNAQPVEAKKEEKTEEKIAETQASDKKQEINSKEVTK